MIGLEIFYDYEGETVVESIKGCLRKVYGLDIIKDMMLKPIKSAYNVKRGQYDASRLLSHLIRNKRGDIALWVIGEDIYCDGMNFVFGLASFRNGAVLSTFRLDSAELIEKEAVHEIGHVLGLDHCSNACVMQFSNSLFDAIKKPSELCDACKKRIGMEDMKST
jgi:archaemetzincin